MTFGTIDDFMTNYKTFEELKTFYNSQIKPKFIYFKQTYKDAFYTDQIFRCSNIVSSDLIFHDYEITPTEIKRLITNIKALLNLKTKHLKELKTQLIKLYVILDTIKG